jgi:putative Ca2+/H+ antiporter (TMEM165/GDT1 family)
VEEDQYKASGRSPLLSSFSLIALGELGDKTQIASIALAAEIGWDSVLVGVMMAFVVLVSLGCFFGARVLSRFPKRTLRIGTASLFIILGVVSVVSVLLGFSLF